MEITMDTVWANQVLVRVETQLDTPHVLTAAMLGELMVNRLKLLVEEVRHANERAAPDYISHRDAVAETALTAEANRERAEYDQMIKDREEKEFEDSRGLGNG
jgi:hypothetical protein